ncbi:hypothetical protein BX616_008431, partial [Lobosporangium transversale]
QRMTHKAARGPSYGIEDSRKRGIRCLPTTRLAHIGRRSLQLWRQSNVSGGSYEFAVTRIWVLGDIFYALSKDISPCHIDDV